MRTASRLSLIFAITFLAGCDRGTQVQANQAANAASADIDATAAEAVADTTNAIDAAGGHMESTINTPDAVEPASAKDAEPVGRR